MSALTQSWKGCSRPIPCAILPAAPKRASCWNWHWKRALCPSENFPRAMRLMKYLYENGVGAEQWLDVLSDYGQQFVKLPTLKTTQTAQIAEPGRRFVAFV